MLTQKNESSKIWTGKSEGGTNNLKNGFEGAG